MSCLCMQGIYYSTRFNLIWSMQGLTVDIQKQNEIPAGGGRAPDVIGVWFSKAAIVEKPTDAFVEE